jgi:Spy/CpxP family protein refolding chaperone
MLRKLFVPCVLLVCAIGVVGQSTPPASSTPSPAQPGNGGPCFQKAGIEKSVMKQLFSIQRESHSQIQNVCSDTSLTAQQKQQQVRQIHQQTHQKIEGLITPEQEKALMACRQQHQGGNHPGGQLGMDGGCGQWGGAPRGGPNRGSQGSGGSSNPSPSSPPSSQN